MHFKHELYKTLQLDSSGPFGTGLFHLSRLGIQHAQAEVTVGLERVHAKLVGQDVVLQVVGFCL